MPEYDNRYPKTNTGRDIKAFFKIYGDSVVRNCLLKTGNPIQHPPQLVVSRKGRKIVKISCRGGYTMGIFNRRTYHVDCQGCPLLQK